MIRLSQISWDNFKECINLSVQKDQERYVASNLYSFAESYMNVTYGVCEAQPLAIYHDDTMIGFTLLYYKKQKEGNYYEIRRFMIDQKYQGKGYGKKAFHTIMEYIRTLPMGPATRAVLDYMPSNDTASHIYHSYGFQDTDEYNQDGEVRTVYIL